MKYLLLIVLTINAIALPDTLETHCYKAPEHEHQAIQSSKCYLANGQTKKAIEYLKRALTNLHASKPLTLLMAKAYLVDNNILWALKTLYTYTKSQPDNIEAWSWIIWCHIQLGQLDKASTLLNKMNPTDNSAEITRQKLFSSLLNVYKKHEMQALDDFSATRKGADIYREDLELYRYLQRRLYPAWHGLLQVEATALSGFSTNPSVTSSFGEERDTLSSLFTGFNASLRFEPILSKNITPFLALAEKTLIYSNRDASGYNYFSPEMRLGLTLNLFNILLAPSYYAGAFLLNSKNRFPPEDTLWFEKRLLPAETRWLYEFHRVETDFFLPKNISVLAGFGRRFFNHWVRSRWEGDITVVMPRLSVKSVYFTGAFSARYHSARKNVFDVMGGTSLLTSKYHVNRRLYLSLNTVFSGDYYPNSMDFFTKKRRRKDLLVNIHPAIEYRLFNFLKLSLSYEFAYRYSNADDYKFTDHRINFGIRMHKDFSFISLNPVEQRHHVAMPYQLEGDLNGKDLESIRELLNRREEIQRSSTCLE